MATKELTCPRGNVYFAEPYTPAQTNVPTPNFAYRENKQGIRNKVNFVNILP